MNTPLLTGSISTSPGVQSQYPRHDANMFTRLVRDPKTGSHKERQCAEMLCSVLQNSDEFRGRFIDLLSRVSEQQIPSDPYQIIIETEQPIGTTLKRDDLRIRFVSPTLDDGPAKVETLWTIEIKIRDVLHYSSPIEAVETDEDQVTQIQNYDAWLQEQRAPNKAGFLLLVHSRSIDLPEGLTQAWHKITWDAVTDICSEVVSVPDCLPVDVFLCSHLAGYTATFLRGVGTKMPIGVSELSFLSYLESMGKEIATRIDGLVEELRPELEAVAFSSAPVNHQAWLFNSHHTRSILWQYLVAGSYPTLNLGVVTNAGNSELVVWVETSPSHDLKDRIAELVPSLLLSLNEGREDRVQSDPFWTLPPEHGANWWDVCARQPLSFLLDQEDQFSIAKGYVRRALMDIRRTGLIERLCEQ